MPAFQRKQRVLGRKQLQGALPAAFLVLAAQSMAFLPGARFDHSHRDFAAGEHGFDCLDAPPYLKPLLAPYFGMACARSM
jgi:hypothetical protein